MQLRRAKGTCSCNHYYERITRTDSTVGNNQKLMSCHGGSFERRHANKHLDAEVLSTSTFYQVKKKMFVELSAFSGGKKK